MTSPPAVAHGGKIADLQILRGIAIVLVICEHATLTGCIAARLGLAGVPFWLAVDLFFVLSGYVIARSLARDDWHPWRFLFRRATRLTPALLIFLAGVLLLQIAAHACPASWILRSEFVRYGLRSYWPTFWHDVAAVVAGAYTLVHISGAQALGAMWSLSIEDQSYWSLAAVCVWCRRRGLTPARTGSAVFGCAAALYAVAVVLRLQVALTGTMPQVGALGYLLSWRLDHLALGVLLAALEPGAGAFVRRRCASAGRWLAPALLAGTLIWIEYCGQPRDGQQGWLMGVGLLLAGPALTAVVLLGAHGLAFPSLPPRLRGALVALGDRSYTLYLWHIPANIIAWWILRLAGWKSLPTGILYGVLQVLIIVPLLWLICDPLYRKFELPITAWGKAAARRYWPD